MKKPTKPITEAVISFNPEYAAGIYGRHYSAEIHIDPDNFEEDADFFRHIANIRKAFFELYSVLEGEPPDDITLFCGEDRITA